MNYRFVTYEERSDFVCLFCTAVSLILTALSLSVVLFDQNLT